ncbi:uncharacterized protein LOC100826953 [Brachypodium distachyon]|uniref:G-protein coupled receptors family 1 profile domain-containing protein n=1 Tax=Brachypodium distachyon TaxID=15368 RepID=I1HU26_BRADI|nr:uncharacterized protein LOC100826953 [Brachypodium distachyon]KQK10938.1 hypothetical protein BRADI_2g57170v3 [Brachypodium distachyon]|eukprot:XP_003564791.1 uncharacterized protein LOC100826953 [Brachypodium distachyon]
MHLTREAADAFGVVTIALFALFLALGLFCIFQSIYFRFRIRKGTFLPLGYFNGPWVTRIALILITIWWGVGEIVRLSFLKRKLFSSLGWQQIVCDAYILSNLGFAEPSIFLAFAFLLHGSLQKRELGTLNQRWNWKTMGYMLVFCVPVFSVQALLVFVGPIFVKDENNTHGRRKIAKYFIRTSMPVGDTNVCTYPLFGTIFLGLVDAILMSYVSYVGSRVLSLVINKALRRRVSLLIMSVLFFLPIRVLLLGFSVLPQPGDVAFEVIVFLSFLMMLSCTTVGVLLLVYYPVADSLALREIGHREISEMVPYDDYYYEGTSLVANQSFRETERNSDTSTKRGSISFRTMIREDQLPQDGIDEIGFSSRSGVQIGSSSPSGSSPSAAMPMLPLKEVPRY